MFLLVVGLGGAACIAGLVWLGADGPTPSGAPSRPARATEARRGPPVSQGALPSGPLTGSCAAPAGDGEAVQANALSLTSAPWSVFGRPETGWAVYAPLVAREVGTACAPDRAGFAEALKTWQATHGLAATGAMTAPTLQALKLVWLARRPFVAATRGGACPPPPADELLITARPDEGYRGKVVRLHARALDAYRRLVAAARSERPEIAADPRLLTIVSGYRGPDEEAARCTGLGSCGTPSMARCSAHRTGTALDLLLSSEAGSAPASSDDANRQLQSRSPAYRWLVANADRFGFTPYPFEPWHWEYTRPDAQPAASPPGFSDPAGAGGRPGAGA